MDVVRKTELPAGAVLLEKESVPDIPLQKVPKVLCAVCWKSDRKRPAAVALKEDPIRFVPIDADLEQPFMGLCGPHARKIQKKLKQRVRQIRRYATNLYGTQE